MVKSGRDRHIISTRHYCIVVQVVAGKTLFIPARATMMHTRYCGLSRACSRQNFPVVVLTHLECAGWWIRWLEWKWRLAPTSAAKTLKARRTLRSENSSDPRDEVSRWTRIIHTCNRLTSLYLIGLSKVNDNFKDIFITHSKAKRCPAA